MGHPQNLKLYNVLVFFFLLFNCLTSGFSQGNEIDPETSIAGYNRRIWKEIKNIPIDRVFDVAQDKDGYLWIASDRGVLRFDGTEVLAFNLKSSPAIETESISNILVDDNNVVWLSTRRGLHYIKDEVLYTVKKTNGEHFKRIFNIALGVDNTIWFASEEVLYAIKNYKVVEKETRDDKFYKVYQGANKKVWIVKYGLRKDKVFLIDTEGNLNALDLGKEPVLVESIAEQENGNLIFGTFHGELLEYDNGKIKRLNTQDDDSSIIRIVTIGRSGEVFYTHQTKGGVYKYYQGKLDTFNQSVGLSNDVIHRFFIDNSGNLWVATEDGLNYFSNSPYRLLSSFNDFIGKQERVSWVSQDDFNGIWASSKSSNLLLFQEGEWHDFNHLNFKGKIHVVKQFPNEPKWIVGGENGLFVLEKSDHGFYISKTLNIDPIGNLDLLHDNSILYQSEGQLYVYRDGKTKKISSRDKIKLNHGLILADNSYVLATNYGVYKLRNDSLSYFVDHPIAKTKFIFKVVPGKSNDYWITTYGSGVVHVNADGESTHYDTRNGLPANQAMFLVATDKNEFWYYVNDGKNGKLQRCIAYDHNGQPEIAIGEDYEFGVNGKLIPLFNSSRYAQTEDATYLFPGELGVLTFNPFNLKLKPPHLYINMVTTNSDVLLKEDKTIYKPGTGDFQFHYGAIDFLRGDQQQFEFKLEGYDNEWNEVGARRVAYYSSLPSGNYSFNLRLKSGNNNYIYLNQPYTFKVDQFWYLHPMVILGFVVLFLGLVMLLFFWRLSIIKKQKRQLQIKVNERTEELRELNENLEGIVEQRTKTITKINEVLTKSEEQYKYALEASNDGIWDWDVQTNTIKFSPAIYTMLGYEPFEFEESREGLYNCIDAEDQAKYHKSKHDYLAEKANDKQLLDEYKMITKKGEPVWILVKGKVVERTPDGKPKRLVGTHTDITGDKRKTQELLEAVLKTEDTERSRISKEIHDGLQQTLTIASLNFQSFKKELHNFNSKAKEKFETGWNYLQDSIKESRVVAHTLMPKAIVDFGIIPAYVSLIDEMDKVAENTTYSFYHNFEEEKLENQQIEITLYRILQESINNIVKYAQATKVDVQLRSYSDVYMLTIEDNGIGFDVKQILEEGKGLGFKSMQNRLDAINGFIEINSQPGKGTSLLVEINKMSL